MSLDSTNAGALSDGTQEVLEQAGDEESLLQQRPPQPAAASGRSKASYKR